MTGKMTDMARSRRVLLAIGCSRGSERGILRGIIRYSRFHGPWVLYREPPFYRKAPYCPYPKYAKAALCLQDYDADGVIAFVANYAQLRHAIPPDFPAVILPIEDKIRGCCSIVDEDGAVGRLAAEHFLERGLTHFAFCGFDHMYWSRVRQEGFTRRLAESGHMVHAYEPPNLSVRRLPEAEQTSVAKWLKSLPKPIGLLACNDDRAQQVFEANKTAGMHVPDEIAILGVDNDDMICELTNPPLSSIAMNFEEVGHEAAAHLDRQMRGKHVSAEEIYVRPTHIQTRQSTDMLAVEDPLVAKALRLIRHHGCELRSVEEVLKTTTASRRLLERHFRQAMGISIYKEIQRVRIERVCQMLVETNWSLANIAERCSFSNAVHMSVAFKRQMQLTPEQYRKRSVSTSR